MKVFDVLVAGELNVDLIMNQMPKLPELGREVIAENMTITLGSSSAIFASNLSSLGSSVSFVGKLGHDNFGVFIAASLKTRGVDVSNLQYDEVSSTGATVVLNFSEDRAMVTYPGAMKHFTQSDISVQALQSARHLHISSIFLQEGLKKDVIRLLRRAKDLGLTTSVDPQWDPEEKWEISISDLLSYTDIFMPNVSELKAMSGTSTLEEALAFARQFNKVIVAKNGSDGAYLWDGVKLIHQPAFLNKNVVDSIGAGDSFNSGFIHTYLKNKPWKDCLEFGALTGALNTTRAGGTGAFENPALIREIARNTFNYAV